MMSVCGSCSRIGNFIVCHGMVYIFGSSIVSDHSRSSESTRRNVSMMRARSLIGRPVESSQTRSSASVPTVCTSSVLSSIHLPTE